MKLRTVLGLLLPLALVAVVTRVARADEKAGCLDAAAKGQTLRNAHKLVEAREQLRACAAAACPAAVQSDCANWLAEVEKALPSVVVTAKDGAGADLVDVKVSVDGQPLVSKLDGRAVPLNAGPHAFHFEGAGGASLDRQVLVKEGETNQSVAVVLGAAASLPPPSGASTAPAASPSAASPAESGGSSHAWRTAGWVLGSAGVVGLGVGAVFGGMAMADKSSAHCVNNVCDAGTVSGIKSHALASDIGWIAGGVLLASGGALILFTPSGGHEAATGLRVAPVVTAGGGGLMAGGSW